MKKKYLWAGLGGAFLLVLLVLAVWLIPLVRTVFLIRGMAKSGGFQYEAAVEIEEENLSKQQKDIIRLLSWALTGKENAGMSWEITGRMSEELVYGKVFCQGSSEPVTELYLDQDEAFVNLEMFYDSIRDNVPRQQPFLGSLFPEWKYGAFLSSRQAEEIFQIDLKEWFRPQELAETQTYSVRELLGLLLKLKRQKGPGGERQFVLEAGDYQAVLEIAKKEQAPLLKVLVSDRTESKEVSAYTGTFIFRKTEEIVLPDSKIEDEDIRQLAKLWNAVCSYL
ncbi:MAG: hypothetical protein HFH50_15660 [Lachnospiraceae bacterium]|jgi:hypothetical protein|nr:hypothetical protein [Lachnospiraceae bacterium]